MNYCCNGFLSFFESIPDSIASEEDFINHISSRIPILADSVGLGRLDMEFCMNPTPFEAGKSTENIILYEHISGYDNFFLTDTYRDSEESTMSYTFYPQKKHIWSDDEKRMLHFLTNQIYLLYSRIRLLDRIQKASITDPLTGVLNTGGFIKCGSLLKEQNKLTDYTGIFLNLKGFRYINQRFGFPQGNSSMRKYTKRIQSYLKKDELFARLGCDNFALLIHNERLDSLLDSLLSVRIHIQHEDFVNTFDISARAGIYTIKPDDSISDVLNKITVAGMLAKTSLHHNTIWFRDSMIERYIHDKEISNSFAPALKDREFMIYYQPKVLLDGQTLCGCEALIRWKRNDKIIPPSEFIPILEHEGTICLLDFYVLECVCQDIRNWLNQGIEPVRISTNFSKVHLHNKNLAKDILKVLDRYQIDAKYLEIELTESSGYEDFDALSDFVNVMKANGIHTSIDDFGTGYSSLNLLKNLNIDNIKLDKSFLNPVESTSKSDEIVIKTIINLAADLNMQVVCEGVETPEHASFLKSLQCPIVQGFLFDEPLTHDEFEERLKTNRIYHKLDE